MDAFRRVVVPIDFSSCSTSAVAFAGAVADDGAHITLLHVYPFTTVAGGESLYPPPMTALDERTRESLIDKLEVLGETLRGVRRTIEVVVHEGDPAREILAAADRRGADLIIMGMHGRHGLDRLLLGSVTEYVAPRARCSVLGVRGSETGESLSVPTLSSLLCAVDLAPTSHDTVAVAASLARRAGARLTLQHVIEPWHWDDPWSLARGDEAKTRRLLAESAHERLSKLASRHATRGQVIDTLISFGRPQDEIVRAVEQCGADLLIVGAHARSGIERFVFGSNAQRVLTASPGAVLIARPVRAGAERDIRDEEREAVEV